MAAKHSNAAGGATAKASVSHSSASPNGRQEEITEQPIRTTVALPPELYWRVAGWCVTHRKRKGDGIVELVQAGMAAVSGG
jgi:hypothetical protein